MGVVSDPQNRNNRPFCKIGYTNRAAPSHVFREDLRNCSMATNGNGKSQNLMVATELESAVRGRYAAASQQHEACLCVPSQGYEPQYLKMIPQEIIERDYGCGDPSRYVNPGEVVLDLGSGGGKICYICAQKVGENGKVIGVDFNQPMLNLVRPGDKRSLFEEMFRVLKVGGRCVISDIVSDEDVPQDMQDDPDLWSGCISGAFREDHFLKMFENAGFYGMHV